MQQALPRLYRIGLHGLAWLAVLLVTNVLSFRRTIRLDDVLDHPHDVKVLLSWLLLIGFFYLHLHVLIPRFYLRGRRAVYVATLLVCLIVIVFLPEVLLPAPGGYGPPPRPRGGGGRWGGFAPPPKPPLTEEYGSFLLVYVITVLSSLSYRISRQLQRTESRRLRSELNLLKAQIQPHFLFNTLNTIYALAVRKDDRTPATIVQLSEFLRYVVDQQNSDPPVDLRRELAYLESYLGLQRARHRDAVTVRYAVDGDPAGFRIAPLILFTYVENAFKHGVSPEEPSVIDIRLSVGHGRLTLVVVNNLVDIRYRDAGSGVGLENTRQRLELLYPGAYDLSVGRDLKTYRVSLTLPSL